MVAKHVHNTTQALQWMDSPFAWVKQYKKANFYKSNLQGHVKNLTWDPEHRKTFLQFNMTCLSTWISQQFSPEIWKANETGGGGLLTVQGWDVTRGRRRRSVQRSGTKCCVDLYSGAAPTAEERGDASQCGHRGGPRSSATVRHVEVTSSL